ncbi:MAG: MASE1 domain-containing protein [Acidobacteria bacterium]|nr:MASE1 domain-containing protein [Acidobacteriota bacterium]
MDAVGERVLSPTRRRVSESTTLRVCLFVAAYYLAVTLAQLSQAGPNSVTAIWPASGLVLAVLTLSPRRRWPLWLAVTWLTNAALGLAGGLPSLVAVAYSTADIIEEGLAAMLLVRAVGTPVTLGRLKEVVALVLVAAVGSNAITAVMGAAVTAFNRGLPFWPTWFSWWMSNGVGMLQVAPLILAWRDGVRHMKDKGLMGGIEIGALLTTLAAVSVMVFQPFADPHTGPGLPLYLVFPWLMWAALRTGPFVATVASIIVTGFAVWSTVHGAGPFVADARTVSGQVLMLQSFVCIAVLLSLLTAAVVAEQKRAQASIERYHLLSEHATDIMFVFRGDDLALLEVNAAAAVAYGFAPDDLTGRSVLDIVAPEAQPGLAARAQRAMDNRVRFESVHRRSDGTTFPVEVSSRGMMVGGDPVLLAVVRDVTERKKAEQQILRLNRLYAMLSETSQTVVRVRSREQMFSEVCRIAVEVGLFRLAWIGVIGQPDGPFEVVAASGPAIGYLRDRTGPPDPPPDEGNPSGTLTCRDRLVVVNDIQLLKSSASWRTEALASGFLAAASVPLMIEGRVFGAFSMYAAEPGFFDPVEAQLLEQLGATISFGLESMELEARQIDLETELRQAQKMEAVGRLAGGIAHDFNNLLQVIRGFTELALDAMPKASADREPLEEVRKAAERATELTGRLLVFSRKQVMAPVVCDLNTVIADVESMLRRLIGEDIELTTVLAAGLGRVRADPNLLQQVVLNLAVNARDAMPHGGRLTLRTANVEIREADVAQHGNLLAGPHAMLVVSDTGTGMSEAVQARIFEPFFTTKTRGKGTGLGLSTVYGIVRQSGGHVTFTSQVDGGTTFQVFLPAVEEALTDSSPGVRRPEPGRGSETILLVEDEGAVRVLARTLLERSGYRVLEASSGAEALRIADTFLEPIQLILTDVIMPGMAGPDVVRRVQTTRPAIRVLYMSGYTDDAISHHGVLEEGATLIPKPFSAEALGAKVREVLDATGGVCA